MNKAGSCHTLSCFLFLSSCCICLPAARLSGQYNDSAVARIQVFQKKETGISTDRSGVFPPDSLAAENEIKKLKQFVFSGDIPAYGHQLLSHLPPPVNKRFRERAAPSTDNLFYLIIFLGFLLGMLRTAFPAYFNNLFRVFFNTSLRQNQLTDQLLQTPLPSLLFNIFFVLSSSVLIYLCLGYSGHLAVSESWAVLIVCILSLLSIYFGKFCFFKFAGWVSGMKADANNYIFIVFLVNKILGICFLPLLPLIAFSGGSMAAFAVTASLIIWILLMAIRFLRTYGLAFGSLRIHRFHFVLYIIALEIIPLLILFKGAQIWLDKKM